jgi:hypothetical protein
MEESAPFSARVGDAYPPDLARATRERWPANAHPLPEPGALEALVSACYQASLLRDEGRAVEFRLLLAPPGDFPAGSGPPSGMHRLVFTSARPCNPAELRRLSVAADFGRALIGAEVREGVPVIWGLLVSGPRWLQAAHGGRAPVDPLPPALTVLVTGAGDITVSAGPTEVARLDEGCLTTSVTDVFASRWLPDSFASARAAVVDAHAAMRRARGLPPVDIDPELVRFVAQQMVRRVIAAVRAAHHGATVVVLPADRPAAPELRIGWEFADGEARRRFRTLMLAIIDRLVEIECARPDDPEPRISWSAFAASLDGTLARHDEAVFELAYTIAALAATDGAVVLTKEFEMLGFGAEIVGDLPEVHQVARALDIDGEAREMESVAGVGTRHRSAYRLCQAVRDAVVIVMSQDGDVRFVRWLDGAVTYWDEGAVSRTARVVA